MTFIDGIWPWLTGDRLLIALVRALCLVLVLLLGGVLLPGELALLELLVRLCGS